MVTLLEDLHVCWYQVNKQSDGSFKILCNDEWLEAVRNKQIRQQDGNLYHANLPSPIECKLLLEPSNTEPCPSGLHIAHVYVIPRQGRVRYSKIHKADSLYTDNSLGQLMCLVDYELVQQERKKGTATVVPIQSNTFSEEVFEDITTLLSSNDHPGSQFLVGHSTTETAFYLCFRHHPFRLKDVICYSPTLLCGSHRPLFIVYQLLQYLRWLHSHGLTHDSIRTTNLYVDEKLWLNVGAPKLGLLPVPGEEVKQIEKKLFYPFTGPPDSLLSACGAWIKGYLSNLDYLLLLNQYSGKVIGDPNIHPVIPWVMDFSSSYGGWRDLSKSKFRMNKGDQHLDSTYKIHGLRVSAPSWMRSRRSFHEEESETPITPHHLIDTLSEITYFSYKARRMPKALLCKYVRSKWEPQEYPATMTHLYKWSPDECIPEFYTDKTIFASVHSDLPDLALPPWASDSQDFIRKHRDALEGDYVSSRLHNWIDLMFGEKLFGNAAIASKNVFKELVDNHKTITNKGVRQLFQFAHPRRLSSSPAIPHLPHSMLEIVAANKAELCEEPDYEEDQDNMPPRRNTYQVKETEARIPAQRNHSVDPSLLKNLINKKYQRSEGARLDSIQELIFSPVRLSKEEENITAKIRYLNQFFSSLGGSIWVDEEKETTSSSPTPSAPATPLAPATSPATPLAPPTSPATPLSLKARQRRDIQSVGCVLIEILSSTHIPEYENMSWERYLHEATFLWNKNKDDIFMCFNDLIEYFLHSDDVFCTTDYLLHPHFNNLAMPPYFDSLYNLIFSLEQQDTVESLISHCGNYLKNNPKFLPSLGSSGMLLLLGYLKPTFSGTHSCKAFIKLFDDIAVHCDHKALELLSGCLEMFYRTCTSPSERIMLSNVNFIMSVKRHFGLHAFLNKFIGHIIENIVDTDSSTTFQTETQTWTTQVQASPLALECYSTLKQVLPTLGPILTAKHVTNKLLQVLVGCHVYNEVTDSRPGGEELITKFLIDIALIYGEAFIDTQYIPRVFNMIKSAMFRVTNKNEGKLLAALNVVGDSIKCLDGPTLHNMLGDLQRFIFEPIMRLLTSSRIIFPHSGSGRLLLCRALSLLLVSIVKHVQYSNIQDPEAGKSLVLPLVKQYFLMFDAVSYLYLEDVTTPENSGCSAGGNGGTDVLSPSQYSLLSQDADYFIHLKQQFPLYPKRYHSHSMTESDPCQIDLGSSPVSGELNLADALQLECESIVEQQLPKAPNQETSSDTETTDEPSENVEEEEEEDAEANIHFCLLPPGADIMSRGSRAVRHVSVIGTDTDPDSYSMDKETPGMRGTRPSSPSLSSESESDETIPEDPVIDVDCLSDGSKKERTIQAQIESCLAPEVAQNTYVHLCRLIGQETLRRTLDNIELIEVLAYMDIPYVEITNDNAPKPRYGSESNSVPYTYPSPLLSSKPLDQCDSLRDNWRRVWESSVTSTSDHFSFKHVFLQQFTGHSDRINALRVTDDECFLLSGSKDKTVILWDLRATNTGLGGKIKRFEEHVRPVLGLTYLDYSYTVVSMDTQQTICTDLERQKVVAKYDSKNAVVLTNLPRASNRIIQGTSDSTLRTFDTRVKDGVVMEWKVATPLRSVQIIKALQCDPTGTWVAAGFSSGTIHVLDLRVGVMMHAFRPHQQDVTKIICSETGDVFTSSNDTNVSVCHWKRARTFTEGNQPDYKYQGYRDGVNGMCLLDDDLITCANYRITTISPAGNSTTKLRSDLFRGGVSAMTVSPLNKLIVLGSDSGSLRLLS